MTVDSNPETKCRKTGTLEPLQGRGDAANGAESGSGLGLEDQIEWRFSRPPEPGESGVGGNLTQALFAGLRPQTQADPFPEDDQGTGDRRPKITH
jgi:hypothetical protein